MIKVTNVLFAEINMKEKNLFIKEILLDKMGHLEHIFFLLTTHLCPRALPAPLTYRL